MGIPYELLDEILCRLPVKPLLRSRCVSKGWCSLIDSNAFVKKHLQNTLDCNASGVHVIYGADGRFWLADSGSLEDGSTSFVEINDPIKTLLLGSEYSSAANALVCVYKYQVNYIFLFNPSTRKVKKLPSGPPEFPRSFHAIEDCICGFGYDHVNDDYKFTALKPILDCNASGVHVIYGADGRFWLADSGSLEDGSTSFVEINDPIKTLLLGSEYSSAANALVCVYKYQVNDIFLFNPSTRKVKKLPSGPPEFPRSFHAIEDCICGFGYDHVNDDYKVLKISQCLVQFSGFMVIVYSLKTNSWTRIQNVPSKFFLTKWGMFSNGTLYWFTIKNSVHGCETIVGFDLGLEQFKEVPFPPVNKKFVKNNARGLFTPPVGESLCFLDTYPNLSVDVWLMNKYGAKNPWYKAFSVKQSCPLDFGILRPLAFSKSHKDVLLELDCEKLVWYNLERKTVKNVRLPRLPVRFVSHFCTESLLQLTDDKSLQKPSKDKLEKKRQKRRDDYLSRGFNLRL